MAHTHRQPSPDLLGRLSDPPSGCDSPRSKVARKLGSLDLEPETPRKRTRLSSEEVFASREEAQSPASEVRSSNHEQEASVAPPTANTKHVDQQARLYHFLHTTKPRRLRSPPPPAGIGVLSDKTDQPGDDLPVALAWQESEITGMNVDFAAGDDGTGMNGVAFRPSPQVAYARKQRRRQQVSEWKAREAREARIKRLERRNGRLVEDEGLRKHLVRFVEPSL